MTDDWADAEGVEVGIGEHLVSEVAEGACEDACEIVDASCDGGQALRPVVAGVHAGDDGEQSLRGADVACGFFASDVLFAGLDGHAEGGVALGIFADADDSTREFAGVFVLGGDECGVRPASAHGDAKALGASDGDVCAPLAWRPDERECDEISGADDHCAGGVNMLGEGLEAVDSTVGSGVLDEDAADFGEVEGGEVGAALARGEGVEREDAQGDAERVGARGADRDGLRMAVCGDEELFASA